MDKLTLRTDTPWARFSLGVASFEKKYRAFGWPGTDKSATTLDQVTSLDEGFDPGGHCLEKDEENEWTQTQCSPKYSEKGCTSRAWGPAATEKP